MDRRPFPSHGPTGALATLPLLEARSEGVVSGFVVLEAKSGSGCLDERRSSSPAPFFFFPEVLAILPAMAMLRALLTVSRNHVRVLVVLCRKVAGPSSVLEAASGLCWLDPTRRLIASFVPLCFAAIPARHKPRAQGNLGGHRWCSGFP